MASRIPLGLHRSCELSPSASHDQTVESCTEERIRCSQETRGRKRRYMVSFPGFLERHNPKCQKVPSRARLGQSFSQGRNRQALAQKSSWCLSSWCFLVWGHGARFRSCVSTWCQGLASRSVRGLCLHPSWNLFLASSQIDQSQPYSQALYSSIRSSQTDQLDWWY